MLTVHHLNHSQSFRIVWLLEELDGSVEYELKLYKRDEDDMMAPPEYKALSSMGTAPTITDSNGLVLNESNAIIEYILDLADDSSGGSDKAKQLRPPSTSKDRTKYLFWFHGVQGAYLMSFHDSDSHDAIMAAVVSYQNEVYIRLP